MARSKTSASNPFAKAFGEALDRQMRSNGVTPAALVRATGMDAAYVSRIRHGSMPPTASTVANFASALNASGDAFETLKQAAASAAYATNVIVPSTQTCPHCGTTFPTKK